MRKLLLLTALCLIFVAAPAPIRKVSAVEFGGTCNVAKAKAAILQAVANSTCVNEPSSGACEEAQNAALDAAAEAQIVCWTFR